MLINYVRKAFGSGQKLSCWSAASDPSGILFHYSSEIFMGSHSPCLVSIRFLHGLIFQRLLWIYSRLALFSFHAASDIIDKT